MNRTFYEVYLTIVAVIILIIVTLSQGKQIKELKEKLDSLPDGGYISEQSMIDDGRFDIVHERIDDLDQTWEETWNRYQVDPTNADWGLSMHMGRIEQRMDEIYLYQLDMIRCIEDGGG